MKIEQLVLAFVAALCLHCGGSNTPAQDPSTPPTGDADAAAPQDAAQPNK
jgi:hypothetical protein